jgi:hypothetical protein
MLFGPRRAMNQASGPPERNKKLKFDGEVTIACPAEDQN